MHISQPPHIMLMCMGGVASSLYSSLHVCIHGAYFLPMHSSRGAVIERLAVISVSQYPPDCHAHATAPTHHTDVYEGCGIKPVFKPTCMYTWCISVVNAQPQGCCNSEACSDHSVTVPPRLPCTFHSHPTNPNDVCGVCATKLVSRHALRRACYTSAVNS